MGIEPRTEDLQKSPSGIKSFYLLTHRCDGGFVNLNAGDILALKSVGRNLEINIRHIETCIRMKSHGDGFKFCINSGLVSCLRTL